MRHSFALLGLGLIVGGIHGETIPPSTGPYNVGARRFFVNHTMNGDPTSPNNISSGYLATVYYPTPDNKPCKPKPYLEPELAQLYANLWNFNVSHLTATLRWDASFFPTSLGQTLLFGPGGWGPPSDGYTILMSELASRGYVVAALDHIGEQPFLRLPNGTGIYGLALDYPADLPFLMALNQLRVRETLHFIDYLPMLVAELSAPFETTNLGTFGHSLGGSAALDAALESDLVTAAINLDGTNWGRMIEPNSNLGKPSLILGAEGHTFEIDPTWAYYAEEQQDWWRLLIVNGTGHLDWSDATIWKRFGSTRPLGPIDGERMVDITNAYVVAFFDEHLRGEEQPILNTPSAEYPEVDYIEIHEPDSRFRED
ncbi:platelet-activating factor acetylhydrolase [Stachybotrys elegans]|uniref:1-alkyl-2-acetylglycerophosphocholine esterase n=1 Tax=Stachybotrys elegans TaxID=80388 RepID=A0A8K0WIY2_9HYPO|nr:platelet-activating factor acetylhydrolase [Stachybotrys elegans]